MIFSQLEFPIFLAAVLLAVGLARGNSARKWVLLVASYYFYAYWDWRFLGLLAGTTLLNYLAAAGIAASDRPAVRRAWLWLGVGSGLGALAFFKYFNFFVESFNALLAPTGLRLGTLAIVLPVGISFYTFQALSYTIDVYRGRLERSRNLRDFALFVSFFPQLVAGPIVRAADFLPQLERTHPLTADRAWLALREFSVGFFKKAFLADRVAPFVDEVFAGHGLFDGPTTWLAVLAYAVQIYCDFSGYSDMAIGVARLLGYDLRENFDRPYLAESPAELWHRWHVSLSSWLRDYLYVPLGGNRHGRGRTYLNLGLTMLLGGLWHGAAWTFVFWGAWHGAALALHRWLRETGRLEGLPLRLRQFGGWATTLFVVLIGWVFFRAQGFGAALALLEQMFLPSGGVSWPFPFAVLAIALVAAGHGLYRTRLAPVLDLPRGAWYAPFVVFLLLWLSIVFYPTDFQPFIYFQF